MTRNNYGKNDIIPFSYIREKLSEKSTKILIVAIVRFKKTRKEKNG
jgi:hypothetical protein